MVYGILFVFKGIFNWDFSNYYNSLTTILFFVIGFFINALSVHLLATTSTTFPSEYKHTKFFIVFFILLGISILSDIYKIQNIITIVLNVGIFFGSFLHNLLAPLITVQLKAQWLQPFIMILPLLVQMYWSYLLTTFINPYLVKK